MAYGSKLLSIDQLLAAWQNRNMQEGNRGQMAMQQKAAEQQIEAQKLANDKAKLEMSLLTSPFNIPRESWAGSGNANTPGLDKYISDNQKMQKLSMLTGKNMPNQGISGYGGGGYGRGGGGAEEPPAQPRYSYEGPDHSQAPDTVTAATQLGNIMRGGVPQQEPTIAELLAQEQGNVAGMNSLIGQAQNKGLGDKVSGEDLTGGMRPVGTALNELSDQKKIGSDLFLSGGQMPKNLSAQEQLDLRKKKKSIEESAAKKKVDQGEIKRYQGKMQGSIYWQGLTDSQRESAYNQLEEAIRQNKNIGRILDVDAWLGSMVNSKP